MSDTLQAELSELRAMVETQAAKIAKLERARHPETVPQGRGQGSGRLGDRPASPAPSMDPKLGSGPLSRRDLARWGGLAVASGAGLALGSALLGAEPAGATVGGTFTATGNDNGVDATGAGYGYGISAVGGSGVGGSGGGSGGSFTAGGGDGDGIDAQG